MPNITTKFIIKHYDKKIKKSDDENISNKIYSISQEQVGIEKLKLKNKKYPYEESIFSRLSEMNIDELFTVLDSEYLNYDLMKTVSYMINLILSGKENNIKWKNYFDHLNKPTTKNYTIAYTDGLRGEKTKNSFVIKILTKNSDKDELTHECAVGIFGTNLLRRYIPNFVYMYGFFSKKSPLPIYEMIRGKHFTDSSLNSSQFMSVYLQTLFSIQLAYEKLNFTHYDLHTENVILREVNREKTYIYYPLISGDYYIEINGYISTIIDIARSYISIPDPDGRDEYVQLGKVARTAYAYRHGSSNKGPNPIYDAYKLLCKSLMKMRNDGNKNYSIFKNLLKYFNKEESPDEILDKQEDYYYGLPYTKTVLELSLMDWIKYCIDYCVSNGIQSPLVKEKPSNVLQTFFQKYKNIPKDIPNNIIDRLNYCSLVVENSLIKRYDEDYMKKIKEMMKNDLKEIRYPNAYMKAYNSLD